MGEVYRAVDQETGQVVAVKRLKPELVLKNPTFVERFMREGEVLQQLNHPNIVRIIDTFAADGDHYLVMEYVDGGSLETLLQKQPRLPIDQALRIAIDLADALARIHRLNIIHCDLKPSNVLLTRDGVPQLTDFGAAHIEYTARLAPRGTVIGTVAYMSPEACNDDPLDARTDIWSFGVLLYEMLAGRLPFQHNKLNHLLLAIMIEPPPDIQQLRPDVNDRLADLIYRMLTKNRDQRIPNVRLVGAELEVVSASSPFDTRALHPVTGAIREGQPSSRFASLTTAEAVLPRYNLPHIATPFVGREAELEAIGRLWQAPLPNHRLITLLGLGGIGKTRLALQAALRYLNQFPHGVYFVDLAAIQEADLVMPAIADAIQFNYFGVGDPVAQLLNYLQDKEMLLILDNFEQLTERVELVTKLLEAAPRLRLLVTSRQALEVAGEEVMPLRGLPVPETAETEDVAATAIQLFLQSARRVRLNFSPTADDLAAIRTICQLVDGMPLGIELAAAWMNSLLPGQIAKQISKDIDFLVTSDWDVPLRHQSVRSVFDYSWRLLNREEKQTLARLSVFRGGFSRDAARKVFGASPHTLNALVNKSLVQRAPTATRYTMQDLLRQFADEKLSEVAAEKAWAEKQHALYFLNYLHQRASSLVGKDQSRAVTEIDDEMANVRVAWQWAVAQQDLEALRLGLDALFRFYQLRGRQREGVEAFAQAARTLRLLVDERQMTGDEGDDYRLLLAQLVARQGAYSRFVGRLDEAVLLLQDSLAMARSLGNKQEIAFSLCHLGAADPTNPQAKAYWQESLALAEEIGDQALRAEALNWVAFAAYHEGDAVTAVQLLEESLAIRQALQDERGLAISLSNLGFIHISLGEYDKAQMWLQESIQASEHLNDLHNMASAYTNLSHIALNTHDYLAARRWGEQALQYFREVGDKKGEGLALGNLSEVAFYQQDYETARAICHQCIALYKKLKLSTSSYYNTLGRIALVQQDYQEAWRAFQHAFEEGPDPAVALQILADAAAVLAYDGQRETAVALLTFVQHHPVSEQFVKERASARLQQLEAELSVEQFKAAQAQSDQKELAEWIELIKTYPFPV